MGFQSMRASMKCKCPKCGHEFDAPADNQSKGGHARWKGTKKADRSAAARKAAAARWERVRGLKEWNKAVRNKAAEMDGL